MQQAKENMQRLSECNRRGHTVEEKRIVDALAFWTDVFPNRCVCFECGHEFDLYDEDSYPQICVNPQCRKKYNSIGMFCLPDCILHEKGNKAVMFVNGSVHDKKNRKYKDRYQIMRLKELGYKIFIVKNEEIGKIRQSNLLAMAKTWIDATADNSLFEKIMKEEREY